MSPSATRTTASADLRQTEGGSMEKNRQGQDLIRPSTAALRKCGRIIANIRMSGRTRGAPNSVQSGGQVAGKFRLILRRRRESA
jgi:hypothetical protein